METIIGTSNLIDGFCASFTEQYSQLPDGIYVSPDKSLRIEKIKFHDPRTRTEPPARVGHYSKIVQIQNDLKLTNSGLYYILIWCFIKRPDTRRPDLEVDKETFLLCCAYLLWSMKDAFEDIVPMLRSNPTPANDERIEWLTFQNKY